LARALYPKPALLLLDDVLSAVDQATGRHADGAGRGARACVGAQTASVGAGAGGGVGGVMPFPRPIGC
jgi:hypothetical protein